MPRFVSGLLVCGLSYNGSANATLFTDYPLDASTLPSLSPLSTSVNVVVNMLPGGIRGASVKVDDLRNPLISAATPTALLQDDASGTLSALFTTDAGWENTDRWTLLDAPHFDESDTSITLNGPVAPIVDQLIWIGPECVKVTAVTTIQYNHVCTVTRGQCGSRALVHEINPDAYPAGDNGSKECMTAYSRQVFEGDRSIEAALYQFEMSPNDPMSVSAARFVFCGHLASRPTCDKDFVWTVSVQHLAKTLSQATFPGEGSLDLTYCVQIKSTAPPVTVHQVPGFGSIEPTSVLFRFTVYEFEKLFNVPIHYPQGTKIGQHFINVADDLFADSKVTYEIKATVGGYDWVWKLTKVENPITSVSKNIIKVRGILLHKTKNAKLTDNPVVFEPTANYVGRRDEGLNEGWVRYSGNNETGNTDIEQNRQYLVRVLQGETPPNVSLRIKIKDSFAKTALRLLLSDKGSLDNDATYDSIVGSRGVGLRSSWLNIGSAPSSGLTADQGTQEWLSLHALDSDIYEYTFRAGDNLGDWFANELALRNMILTFIPSTGKLGARYWARPVSGATALTPIHYPVIEVVSGETLPEVRAIFIERGIDPITLDPLYRKPIQTPEARSKDTKGARTLRIWQQGGAIQDSELQSGPLSKLLVAILGVGLGSPRVFRIPLSPSATTQFADQVTWTDTSIPTAIGRGFTTRKLFVLGLDRDCAEGILYAICVEDVVNVEITASASTGEVASGLLVTGIAHLNESTLTALVKVELLSTAGKFHSGKDDSIWTGIVSASGQVHVTRSVHNRQEDLEPQGHREAYANLTAITNDNNSKFAWMSLTFDSEWVTDRGYTLADLIVANDTRIGLPTIKTVNGSAGLKVLPIANQSHNNGAGSDRLHLSPKNIRPRWDNRKSLVG